VSSHVGDSLCEQVELKKPAFLFIGRRGMGNLKRMFVGSNSNYCVQNASCNVVVIKGDWGAPEEHGDLKKIIELEEKERSARIKEDKEREMSTVWDMKRLTKEHEEIVKAIKERSSTTTTATISETTTR